MSVTTYTFSIFNDFTQHAVATDRLSQEIQASSIVTALSRIDTIGDVINIVFKDVLSAPDQTTLNGLVAAHAPVAITVASPVVLNPYSPTVVNAYTTTSGSSFTALRATTFAEVIGSSRRSISSDQAVDFLSGSGAQKVMITYYDGSMSGPFYETLSLSGTTVVQTVSTNICFVERMDIISVGSQLGNVGNVKLFSASNGVGLVMAQIAASDNQTYYAHHYVASNKTARLSGITGFMKGPNGGNISIRIANPLSSSVPEKTVAEILRLAPGITEQISPNVPTAIIGPARILLYAQALGSAGLIDWTAGFNLYEVFT